MAKSAPAEVTELLRGEDFVLEHELGEYEIPAEGKVDPMVSHGDPIFSIH